MWEMLEHPLIQAGILLLIAAAQFSCIVLPTQYQPFAMAVITPLSMTFLWLATFDANVTSKRVLHACIIVQAICLFYFNARMISSLLLVLLF